MEGIQTKILAAAEAKAVSDGRDQPYGDEPPGSYGWTDNHIFRAAVLVADIPGGPRGAALSDPRGGSFSDIDEAVAGYANRNKLLWPPTRRIMTVAASQTPGKPDKAAARIAIYELFGPQIGPPKKATAKKKRRTVKKPVLRGLQGSR